MHLLIKDETNINLLKDYLLFLKKNKTHLEKEKIPYKTFNDELNYYSILFEKDKLKILFGSELESEKSKLVNLMNDYYNNLKKKTSKNFKKKLKNNINQDFSINQFLLIQKKYFIMIVLKQYIVIF